MRRRGTTARVQVHGGGGRGPPAAPKVDVDAAAGPLCLFDLNGTLTSHTAARKSSGRTELRPVRALAPPPTPVALADSPSPGCSRRRAWARCCG